MSTVAVNIRDELAKSNISVAVVSLLNFYRPLRGNLRKNRSRAGSLVEEENKEAVLKEIEAINEAVDFDDPKQIDFDLLIVSSIERFNATTFSEGHGATEAEEAIQLPTVRQVLQSETSG